MLIVGRAVAGIGASGIQNGALTIIAECVAMPKRPGMSQDCFERFCKLNIAAALIGFAMDGMAPVLMTYR